VSEDRRSKFAEYFAGIINAGTVRAYAITVHNALSGSCFASEAAKRGLGTMAGKLIDAYIIDHADEIARAMMEEFLDGVCGGGD